MLGKNHACHDAGTTPLLRVELLCNCGAEPLILDLQQVTFLASAGGQLLHEFLQDERVQLVAPPGAVPPATSLTWPTYRR